MFSAIASAFDGKSVGEFRAWLHTILSRRIADHLEARKRKPQTEKLATEHAGDDEVWGDEPSEEFSGEALHAPSASSRPTARSRTRRTGARSTSTSSDHLSASQAAAEIGDGMREDNVHQIASRFLKRVRELLDEGDTSG